MNLRYPAIVAAVLVTGACAQVPTKQPVAAPQAESKPAEVVKAPPVPAGPVLPKQNLTEQTLYEFLLAEVAAQRGDYKLASAAYLDLAKSTQDPRLAERAAQMSLVARLPESALEAARLWHKLDPASDRALKTLAVLLLNAGKADEAEPLLTKVLETDPDRPQTFVRMGALLGAQKDKQAALALVQKLAKPYPELPEAHFAVAEAAWAAGNGALAEQAIGEAARLRPDWEIAVLFRGQLLQQSSPEKAQKVYEDFLQHYPMAREVRLAYARALVMDKQYEPAREQFQRLLQDFPGSPEVTLAVGLLSLQLKDYDAAEGYFKRVLDMHYGDEAAVRLYLGQVQEDRKDYAGAAKWYGSVGPGSHYLTGRVKYAAMLAKQGRLDEARGVLKQVPVSNNQQRVQLVLAEAQLLRDAKKYQEAYDLVGRALDKLPNYPDLLYEHAMAAEKIDRLDVLEKDLRKLIQIKPDFAQAYNALGYTLADRTDRLGEARQLIEKALQLSPNDPYILDSMGWVEFRLGHHGKAVEYLQRAYGEMADPEIAAHLGEALWVQGQQSEARKVWEAASKAHPENESLLKVMKKYGQ